ncbi:DUF2267 domain-containing protein [Streptomyces cellulosae]
MQHHEFLARVRELGEYMSQDEAAAVTEAVLTVLAQRINPGEADDLVSGGELNQILSQLPSGYAVLFGKPDLTS